MSPPVDFGGLFYRANPQQVDNTPTVQAGAVRGHAYADIGQSIASGLIQRAKMQEEKRQFDIQMTVRKALAHAQEVKDQAIAAHQASQARMQALRDFDTQQHQGVMESQGQQRINLEDQRYQTQQEQFARTQGRLEMEQRRRSDEAAYKRLHQEAEAGAAKKLADEMLQRGDLTDQEHALASMQLDSGDPVQVRQVAQGMVAKSKVLDQRAIDDDLRKAGPKELLQTLTDKRKGIEEAGLKVDPEDFLEARALAVSFGRSHSSGPALAAEFKQLQAKMAGVGTPKAGKTGEAKIVLPSGTPIHDSIGLSKGGSFEDMSREQRQALYALGREQAQKDPAWAMTLVEGVDPVQAKQNQENLSIRYGNDIATLNGWKPGGSQAVADQTAAPITIDTLKQKAISEGWTKERFFEEARKAGIK